MDISNFFVENAGNTCYIDSLLMGLFYDSSRSEELLCKTLKNPNALAIYLQEYIKENFINLVRNNKSVIFDDIEMIRTMCFQLGWRQNALADEYTNQQDVNEFYTFLMDIFENEQIMISRNTISEGSSDKIDIGKDESIPFIPLSLPENQTSITIKDLLHTWLYDNVSDLKRNVNTQKGNEEQMVKGLNTYSIVNSPYLFCVAINRFNNYGIRIQTDVIIQKKISPYNKDIICANKWDFHAAICHRGETSKSGHYYTLLSSNGKWYIFDDLEIPCMREIQMDDKEATNLIKKECTFLIYRLPKFH